jgi:hypothetical protein
MNIKKFLLAALAGFIGLNIAYIILEGGLLSGYIDRVIIQPSGAQPAGDLTGETIVLSLVAIVAISLIMAYVYPKGYEGGSPLAEGLRFGILMGLFYGIPFTFFFGTMFPISFGAILVMALVTTLEVAVGGVLIGLVYGRMEQTNK